AAKPRFMNETITQFTTSAYPCQLRSRAWCEVLAHLHLIAQGATDDSAFTGFATLRDALSGARFGHFNASPHTLQPATSSEDHVLLFVLHEGCGQAITATH